MPRSYTKVEELAAAVFERKASNGDKKVFT